MKYFTKHAFVAPFDTNKGDSTQEWGNYWREQGNIGTGALVGGLAAAPVSVPTYLAAQHFARKGVTEALKTKTPIFGNSKVRGALALTGLAATITSAGALVGGYQGLKKSEQKRYDGEHHVTPGRYAGRLVGSVALPVIGDYATSRFLQKQPIDLEAARTKRMSQ